MTLTEGVGWEVYCCSTLFWLNKSLFFLFHQKLSEFKSLYLAAKPIFFLYIFFSKYLKSAPQSNMLLKGLYTINYISIVTFSHLQARKERFSYRNIVPRKCASIAARLFLILGDSRPNRLRHKDISVYECNSLHGRKQISIHSSFRCSKLTDLTQQAKSF